MKLRPIERSDFRAQQPPGVRSTRDGGHWERGPFIDDHFGADFEHLKEDLSPSDFEVLRAEIRRKMARARSGTLTYGETRRDGDVCHMDSTEAVLEIRFDYWLPLCSERSGDDRDEDGKRTVRLYFAEPEAVEGALVALSLRTKHPYPMGKREQNQHAREAQRVANDWWQTRSA